MNARGQSPGRFSIMRKIPRFTITKRDTRTRARTGILHTAHGNILTPAYVIVATDAKVRTLKSLDVRKTGTQVVIANTYHLWDKRNAHKMLGVRMPMMTDSGGFQLFSFGAAKEHGVGKVLRRPARRGAPKSSVRVSERGVSFTVDGYRRFLSPESSIAIQRRLGADIMFVLDECTSPLHSFAHTKAAMERTHRWAIRCLKAPRGRNQALFGIVQGGRSRQLRAQSARTLARMPFDGFGIGGSFGKNEMRATLASVIKHLPDEKPRHLLGIGTVADVFDAVQSGVDLFDCVIPTREARHGRVYSPDGAYDVRTTRNATSDARLSPRCTCPSCANGATRARLYRLFKAKHPSSGRLATMHNVWFFNDLVARIRTAIRRGEFTRMRDRTLLRFLGR